MECVCFQILCMYFALIFPSLHWFKWMESLGNINQEVINTKAMNNRHDRGRWYRNTSRLVYSNISLAQSQLIMLIVKCSSCGGEVNVKSPGSASWRLKLLVVTEAVVIVSLMWSIQSHQTGQVYSSHLSLLILKFCHPNILILLHLSCRLSRSSHQILPIQTLSPRVFRLSVERAKWFHQIACLFLNGNWLPSTAVFSWIAAYLQTKLRSRGKPTRCVALLNEQWSACLQVVESTLIIMMQTYQVLDIATCRKVLLFISSY